MTPPLYTLYDISETRFLDIYTYVYICIYIHIRYDYSIFIRPIEYKEKRTHNITLLG